VHAQDRRGEHGEAQSSARSWRRKTPASKGIAGVGSAVTGSSRASRCPAWIPDPTT
jgi:hypothetical protein